MKLFPICECDNEEKAVKIASFFVNKGLIFHYVYTGNSSKPYLVISNQEGLTAFEKWTMENTK
jgi:hypothetical protein